MPATATPGGALAPPEPTIAAAILMPQDRIPREALAPWAGKLVAALEQGRKRIRDTRHLAGELGWIGNNAGLVAAHRGDMAEAWRITERQVWWHGRQARRSRDPAVVAYGVQPWVNLGRLESLTGRWREALSRFAGLTGYYLADRLEMGCVRLNGTAWSAVTGSRQEFLEFLETVYVSDSLKAMLLNRRFELVHPFVARFDHGAGTLRWICEEAAVVAECRAGDFGAALARAKAGAREARGWHRMVLKVRVAETLACAGDPEQAADTLRPVAEVVRQVSAEHKANPQLMPATARLAGACHELGLRGEAHGVARDVLEGARTAGDELIQIEMLRVLASTAPDDERAEWIAAARAAEASTDYARFRRGRPASDDPVFEELYRGLDELYTS